jgi:uncharacterized protein YndB with AHSA1/START domain
MTTTRSDAPAANATRNQTTYSTPTDRELVITRTFNAPRSLVWEVFTDPKHVPNWQAGPKGFTMPVCEIDLRPGGTWRYGWRNPQGREFVVVGTYGEVDPPKRLVQMTSANGEQTNTTTFTEENGRTTVTVTQLFESRITRDSTSTSRHGADSWRQ